MNTFTIKDVPEEITNVEQILNAYQNKISFSIAIGFFKFSHPVIEANLICSIDELTAIVQYVVTERDSVCLVPCVAIFVFNLKIKTRSIMCMEIDMFDDSSAGSLEVHILDIESRIGFRAERVTPVCSVTVPREKGAIILKSEFQVNSPDLKEPIVLNSHEKRLVVSPNEPRIWIPAPALV